jgi:hypothetical protein
LWQEGRNGASPKWVIKRVELQTLVSCDSAGELWENVPDRLDNHRSRAANTGIQFVQGTTRRGTDFGGIDCLTQGAQSGSSGARNMMARGASIRIHT